MNHSSSHRMASLNGSLDGFTSSWKTDWSKCCLCQTHNKNEELKSPPIHYSCSNERDGYFMIATNLPLFQIINVLPIVLDPSRLSYGGGIEDTLGRNKAKYDQSCRLMFNNCKLERTRKRTSSTDNQPDEGHIKIRRTSLEGRESWCSLCEKESPASEIKQAMTIQLNERVNDCARLLNDGRLLAKIKWSGCCGKRAITPHV